MSIKIIIADDHTLVRESVSFILSKEFDIEVIGEAEDGHTAVEMAANLHPDVVIMDIMMPKLNGIEAARQITMKQPDIKVLALSALSDRRSIFEMLRAGASGYLLKRCACRELVTAIRNVYANQTYLSPLISGIVVSGYMDHPEQEESSAYALLTPREREVLQLVSDGKPTKTIAKELHLSCKTIEWHRSQLMRKIGVKNVAELVKYAIFKGLICSCT